MDRIADKTAHAKNQGKNARGARQYRGNGNRRWGQVPGLNLTAAGPVTIFVPELQSSDPSATGSAARWQWRRLDGNHLIHHLGTGTESMWMAARLHRIAYDLPRLENPKVQLRGVSECNREAVRRIQQICGSAAAACQNFAVRAYLQKYHPVVLERLAGAFAAIQKFRERELERVYRQYDIHEIHAAVPNGGSANGLVKTRRTYL